MSRKRLNKEIMKLCQALFEGTNLDTQLETILNETDIKIGGEKTDQEKHKEYMSIMNKHRLKLFQLNAQLKFEIQEYINKYGRIY
jgi:hypothetical protein